MQFHIELNRIPPKMRPEMYKTYSWRQPLSSHWRQATCEEVDCIDFLNGFVLTVETDTDLGRKRFDFLTHDKTRSCSIQRLSLGMFKFIYAPGNTCMKAYDHRIQVGRPPRLLVLGGDWRGNPRNVPTIVHSRMDDWIEDFATHQDMIAERFRRG